MNRDNDLPSILIYSSEFWPFYEVIIKILRKKGYMVDLYVYPQDKRMLKYFYELYNLSKIDFKKYDVVHAYFGASGFLANLQRRVPVITTFCGSDLLGVINNDFKYNYLKSYIFKSASKLAYLLSKRTTTLSKELESKLPSSKKNQIVSLGVDISHFHPVSIEDSRKILGWNQNDIYVLFPAEKNRPVKRYFLAKKIIASIELNKKINLISLDEPNMYEKLPLIMNASNLMVFVSKHEGSPNVIREALSCNLPIFSFDVGDVKEQIKHINHCVCVRQDDIYSLKSKIKSFLSANAYKRSDGRKKMINYSWENYVDLTIKLINKSLS